ncbi:MAG: RNA polymerase sigma factor [Candidatus Brocadiia bacterium]
MTDSCDTDGKLIGRAVAGDQEAFGELVRRNKDYVYNAAVHLLGPTPEAEDVAQEVFVKACRGIDGFRGECSFSTWLYGIMLNCVRSRWRKQGRRPDVLSLEANGDEEDDGFSPEPEDTDADGPEERLLREERRDLVRRAILRLPTQFREIVILRDLQDLSYRELSAALDIPLGTVKSRLARARDALREELVPVFMDLS